MIKQNWCMHSAVDNVEFSVIKLSTKLKQHLKKTWNFLTKLRRDISVWNCCSVNSVRPLCFSAAFVNPKVGQKSRLHSRYLQTSFSHDAAVESKRWLKSAGYTAEQAPHTASAVSPVPSQPSNFCCADPPDGLPGTTYWKLGLNYATQHATPWNRDSSFFFAKFH